MGSYYAIHTSIKLKSDAPKEVVSFFDLLYQVIPKREVDNYDQKLLSALTGLFPNSLVFKGELNLPRAICYTSICHDTYKYRGKCNNLYYSFSSSKYNSKEDFKTLLELIFDYLDVKHGDIIYRWVWEDGPREELLWVDLENRKIVQAVGYKYKSHECGYLCDDTHPWYQEGDDVPVIHYENHFDMVNKVKGTEGFDRFSFLSESKDDQIF